MSGADCSSRASSPSWPARLPSMSLPLLSSACRVVEDGISDTVACTPR